MRARRITHDVALAVDGLGRLNVLVADDGLLSNGGTGLGADLGRGGLVVRVKEVLQTKMSKAGDGCKTCVSVLALLC